MPRSSRHKSSKHTTRDAREHSDSEKEFGLKEKKGRDDDGNGGSSRHLKDVLSGEKRKLDSKSGGLSKDTVDRGNAEFDDEFGGGVSSSSKKRKEAVVDDRWVGGDYSYDHEMSKSEMKEKEVVKGSGDSKRSSRRNGSRVSGFDVEEVKKSGSKTESKHHRSERKERGEKERGSDRERKSSRSDKSERLVDIVSVSEITGSEGNKKQSGSDKERGRKHSLGNTDYEVQEDFRNPEPERDPDRRVGRKRDGSGDGDRHHGTLPGTDDRGRTSREEIARSGRHNNDGHKDERNKDRFVEDVDKDILRQEEKKRDSRSSRDYTGGYSDDKHLRHDKDLHLSHKLSKPHGVEYDRELDRDRERYRDHDRERARNRDRERGRVELDHDRERGDRDHNLALDREQEDLERIHDRDRGLERTRDHGREGYHRELRDRVGIREPERGRERDFDHDHDYTSHVDEKSSRFKDDRGRRRSPDNYEGYQGDKLRRVETEMDKERSLSRKPNVDSGTRSSRHRDSPSSMAYVGEDNYRVGIQDETKYEDSLRDTGIPESAEYHAKYQTGEKRSKFDDSRAGEFSERSPNTKVSPAIVKERSPSASFDRSRFSRRNTTRGSLEANDAERRGSGSIDNRDTNVTEDRQGRDLLSRNSVADHPSAESPFYHKTGQGNVSSRSPGPSVFRTRPDSPSFGGPYGDNNRGPGNRYRRSVDPNVGRGPGNAWNGLPNWSSPLSNGFMLFPPGPPGPHHGGFPPIIPQFPPFYGARPTLEMNHPGIPYHMADVDRLAGHGRPIGWPNIAEGLLPSFHGWEAGNSIRRNDPTMYGPGPDQFPQRMDVNMDNWKQNGDMDTEIVSGSLKDVPASKAFADEASSAHGASKHNVESSCLDDQATSFKDASSDLSPLKEIPLTPAEGTSDKTPESSGADDNARSTCAYLLKLDISMDLVDPELYNQCSLAVKGVCEFIEDEADLDFMEVMTDVESEITKLTVGVKPFPAAKENIYQRAMNLYKTQISERMISMVPDGNKICNHSPSQEEVEQNLVLEEKVNISADCSSIKLEDSTSVRPEEIVLQRDEEKLELALIASDETQMPVFDAEKKEEESSPELIAGNADKGCMGLNLSDPEKDIVVNDGKIVGNDSDSGMQLDDAVSGQLIIFNDAVKDCEGLIPVSNESESVVLSRIHHAPESTH